MQTQFVASWCCPAERGACPTQTNYFAPGAGLAACKPCPRATAAPSSGSQNCTACGVGTFGQGSAQGCVPAAPGYFVNSTGAPHVRAVRASSAAMPSCACLSRVLAAGAIAAQACLKGSFAATNASAACTLCPPGAYAGQNASPTCKVGGGRHGPRAEQHTHWHRCVALAHPAAVPALQPCPDGTFSNVGAPACTPTPAGTYVAAGTNQPQLCPKGTFADVAGLVACKPCTAGYGCSAPGI